MAGPAQGPLSEATDCQGLTQHMGDGHYPGGNQNQAQSQTRGQASAQGRLPGGVMLESSLEGPGTVG